MTPQLWTPPKPAIIFPARWPKERLDGSFLPGMFPGGVAGGVTMTPPLDGLEIGTGGLYGAYSVSRRLRTGYTANSGALYALTSGKVSTVYDQVSLIGNTADLTQSNSALRPVIESAGPFGRAALRFNYAEWLKTTANISAFLSVSNGYIIITAMIPTVHGTNSVANVYKNDAMWGDSGGYVSHNFRNNSGTLSTWAHNYHAGTHYTRGGPLYSTTAPLIFEWWHTGGNLYEQQSGEHDAGGVVSGDTTTLANPLVVGAGYDAVSTFLDGYIFEMALFTNAPPDPNYGMVRRNMAEWVGANLF